MPIRTTPAIAVPAGKTTLRALFTFPTKDESVSVTYMVEISRDGGSTWRDLTGATVRGDTDPIGNQPPHPPLPVFSLAVSHDGTACHLRATFNTSKAHLVDFEML